MSWLTQNGWWILLGIGLLFLFRRVGQHGFGGGRGRHGGYRDGTADAAETAPRQDAETATDPVTGKGVATAHAVTSAYQGRIYYFESPETRQRFEASPEQYVRPGATTATPGSREFGTHRRRRHGC